MYFIQTGFWALRLGGHQLEGGVFSFRAAMLRAGWKQARSVSENPWDAVGVPPWAPLVEVRAVLPGGPPPLPGGERRWARAGWQTIAALSSAPLLLHRASRAPGAVSSEAWQGCSSSADGAAVNRVTLEKSSLHHGVLHSSLQSVGDLINLLADVGAERYISPCLSIPFSVVICLNCKSS